MSRRTQLLTITLLLACLAAVPLISGGGLLNTHSGGDSPFLLQRLQQLETAVLDGHFPVRWMPDATYGYGYPFYNFYAPLSIYIAALFRLLGFSYIHAIQLAQLTGFLVAAWGMFCLAERWFGNEWAGLLAATVYTFAPFHLVNVYVRGDSLAEFWAMAFYPLVILTAEKVLAFRVSRFAFRDSKPMFNLLAPALAWFALAYAGLILSHNISALIFSPFLLLYLLLRLGSKIYQRELSTTALLQVARHLLVAFLLALALAAWFFLPALAEQDMAQLAPVTAGYFHFSNHFRSNDLIQTSFLFDYNPDEGGAFRMGAVQAGTAVFSLLLLFIHRKTYKGWVIWYIFLLTLLASSMITPLSRPLWETLPLLDFTQFPWRFLSVQAFGIALATAVLATLPLRRYLVPGVIALCLIAGLGGLEPDYLPLTDADITAKSLAQYEWFTGNIGTTISAEYLPPGVQPRPVTSHWLNGGERWQIRPLTGTLFTNQRLNDNTIHQLWQVESSTATLLFPTLYWPGWTAEIDGKPAEIRPSPSSGLITLNVPAGQHTISLRLTRTPVRLAAELISAAALIFVLASFKFQISPIRHTPRFSQLTVYGLLLLFILLAIRLWPHPPLPPDNLTWDFQQMGYLHHDTDGVLFTNGARLLTYRYSQEQAAPGDTVDIFITWETADSRPATLSLVTPAFNRFQTPTLASTTQPIQTGTAVFRLPIPANAPAGLYVPQITLLESDPLMPSGKPRGPLFLRPFRITPTSTPTPLNGKFHVQVNQVNSRPDQAIDLQLAWWSAHPLAENLNLSLRLTDDTGHELSQFDTQPGFGFQPSSQWPPATWVHDWLTLPLPASLPPAPHYPLVIRLYSVTSGDLLLTRRLGQLTWAGGELTFQKNEPLFTPPADIIPQTADFTNTANQPVVQLLGYTWQQTADLLQLTLYWQALTDGMADYTRFVHLVTAATPDTPPLLQNDAAPRYNSYPTSQWVTGEVVADEVTFDLTTLPPGTYQLMTGFYYPVNDRFTRLTAVSTDGTPFTAARVPLGRPITVK